MRARLCPMRSRGAVSGCVRVSAAPEVSLPRGMGGQKRFTVSQTFHIEARGCCTQ
eukprot:IDg9177t1